MKRTKTIFFLILIISSNISLVFGIPNEGYGEDSQALGQFVDTFTDLNNISVMENIVRNSTYNAMELNATSAYRWDFDSVDFTDGFEDFPTGWTVVTANGGTITKDNTHVYSGSWAVKVNTPNNNQQAFAYRGMTEQAGDYHVRYYIYPDGGDVPNNCYVLLLHDVSGTTNLITKLDRQGGVFYLVNQGAGGDSNVGILIADQWNKVDINWDDTANKFNYSIDDVFQGLFNAFTDSNPDRIYIGDTSAVGQSGIFWVDAVEIGPASLYPFPIYESSGYFITTNYLNDTMTNGSILVQMTNTSIPDNTVITVEFSNDNSSWILNDWQPIFGGFESIDLRDLNWSTACYIRYNLSTTDNTITPRVYQSRLITTIGNSTGGGGVPAIGGGINSATILMLILLCALAGLIYVGVKKK